MLGNHKRPDGSMLQLRFLPQEQYFLAHLTGLVSVEAWEKGLRDLQDAIGDAPGDRLVVNLTGLVGWLGVPERTAVGALMATHLGRMKKVALYIQPEKIAGVVEAEARRNGLDLRLFSSYDDAVTWAVS
jgi:hypothetical protein